MLLFNLFPARAGPFTGRSAPRTECMPEHVPEYTACPALVDRRSRGWRVKVSLGLPARTRQTGSYRENRIQELVQIGLVLLCGLHRPALSPESPMIKIKFCLFPWPWLSFVRDRLLLKRFTGNWLRVSGPWNELAHNRPLALIRINSRIAWPG